MDIRWQQEKKEIGDICGGMWKKSKKSDHIMSPTKEIRIPNKRSIILKDILLSLGNLELLRWKFTYIDNAFTRYDYHTVLGNNMNILEFEDMVNNSEDGYEVSLKDLLAIDQWIYQFVDLELIGDYDITRLKKYKDEAEAKKSCRVVIICFDSSYWEITCPDDTKLNTKDWKF